MTEVVDFQGLQIRIHGPEDCAGHYCTFHNPSDHHMRGWKINIRDDKLFLVERLCPDQGIGHPDPDSLAYFVRTMKDGEYMGLHGCDGCCHPDH